MERKYANELLPRISLVSVLYSGAQWILLAILTAAAAWGIHGLYRWYRVRRTFQDLKAHGIPLMPHSFVWGHLLIIRDLTKSLPRDMHPNYLAQLVKDNWRTVYPDQPKCPPIIYIDMWPMAPPIMFPVDPDLTAQFLSEVSLPKAKNSNMYLKTLTDNLDMVSAEGTAWKVWRSRFNPGFSSKNVVALVPAIMDEVIVFAETLRGKAGTNEDWGEVFVLETLTTNLTVDVIARAVLDIRLHEQTNGPTLLKTALLEQLSLCMFDLNILTIWSWISPVRALAVHKNNRIMRSFLLPSILSRIGLVSSDRKTVVDLALKTFNEEAGAEGKTASRQPDGHFIDVVLAQLKVFLFAGSDTTATTICWALHSIAKNSSVLAKMREEHDVVLGSEAVARLREMPHLLNALPYTQAVLKETLRLWPVVGPIRDGSASFSFEVSESSVRWPTEGFMIWDGIRASTHSAEIWPRPLEFLPDRWLVDASHELHPPKNAWHPFGIGPRNCIGQELALLEMKLVLILVARDLEIDCAWEQWDVTRGHKSSDTIDGHRCYQSGAGTPHVKDGMPVHVRLARRS